MSKLTEAWDSLHLTGDAGQYVRLRLPQVSACATYAARRVSDGNEVLVLEVEPASIPPQPDYPQSVGFEVRAEMIEPGRFGQTRLLLILANHQYRDIFRTLAEDVIRTLALATGEIEAVRTFVSRLARWQAFLRKHSPDGLTLEARRGLFGELSFLRDQLLREMDGATAVRAWKGCRGAIHDFQLPSGSVEVKTTSAHPARSFRVSNVGQLDERGLPALFLCLTVVEEAEGAIESLPGLIDSIRGRLEAPALEEFDEGLIDSGFLPMHRDHYEKPRYSVRGKRFFRVVPGFPRIDAELLPDGIEEVQYTVSLAACSPFETDTAHMIETIRPMTVSHE